MQRFVTPSARLLRLILRAVKVITLSNQKYRPYGVEPDASMRKLLVCRCTHAARPEFKDRDFYVTGESYAGHYIPAFSHHVWRTNQRKAELDRINLKGLAIGNGGWVEALVYAAS